MFKINSTPESSKSNHSLREHQKSDKVRAMIETMNDEIFKGPVKGPSRKEAIEELLTNSDKYDFVKHAKSSL